MKVVIALAVCCLAVVFAAPSGKNTVLDFVHNFKFVKHSKKNHTLLLAVSDIKSEKVCHIIEADAKLTKALKRHASMVQATEEIYNLIHSGQATEVQLNRTELTDAFHDKYLSKTCRKHKTFVLEYTPTFSFGNPRTTTQNPDGDIVE